MTNLSVRCKYFFFFDLFIIQDVERRYFFSIKTSGYWWIATLKIIWACKIMSGCETFFDIIDLINVNFHWNSFSSSPHTLFSIKFHFSIQNSLFHKTFYWDNWMIFVVQKKEFSQIKQFKLEYSNIQWFVLFSFIISITSSKNFSKVFSKFFICSADLSGKCYASCYFCSVTN